MAQHSRAFLRRYAASIVCFIVAVLFVLGPLSRISIGQGTSPAKRLADLGKKFSGVDQCGGENCHGKPGNQAPPAGPEDRRRELSIWKTDPHAEAYKTLENAESKAIAGKLQIADATTSDRCLDCHSLNVKAELRGKEFSLKEGNSCGSCHGPDEMWMKPHQAEGWTQQQRDAFKPHDALLKKWGLYDTKPYAARAEICAGCHLAIDADMVAAGHPQPTFELAEFDYALAKHWPDAKGYPVAKMWLAGQVVCLRDAMQQLQTRAGGQDPAALKQAYEQAMAHLEVIRPAASLLGMSGLDAAAADLEKAAADPAKAGAKAGEVATMANAALAKIDTIDMNKQSTLQVLGAVAAADGMAKNYGRSGMEQQAWAINALFSAHADGESVPEDKSGPVKDAIGKVLPPEEGQLSAEDFDKGLSAVRPMLPK